MLTGRSRLAAFKIYVTQFEWVWVLPFYEVLVLPRYRRIAANLFAGGDQKLVVPEELLVPFFVVTAPVLIAQKLLDGFADRIWEIGRLAFDDRKGQAVHKENNVGDDVIF